LITTLPFFLLQTRATQTMDCTETGNKLVHWLATKQLPGEVILKHLNWKEALRLAASSPFLWPHVERLVALALPNRQVGLKPSTPDRLRIPLLTGVTREQVRANDNEALQEACEYGHLAVAQWLVERFQLTAADARTCNNEALRGACENGHLAVARWLTERFQLTADDARAINNHALRWARCLGHSDVVHWLKTEFDITQEEIDKLRRR